MNVLITGASSGIGEGCARWLDARGHRVFAGVRRAEDGERLRIGASERLTPVLLDVTVSVYQDYMIVDPDAFAPYPREYIIDGNGTVLYTDGSIDTAAISAVLDSVL